MKLKSFFAAFSAVHFLALTLFGQGSLTPPGAPSPTLKTLQQIEPRTDLQAPTLPPGVSTDANYHFIIDQPGSYYLSANLGVTKTNGIRINAEGVTLDLNGYQISRASGSGGDAIDIAGTSHRTSIRNGSVKGFAYGISALFGPGFPRACVFRDLTVSGCTNSGILAGEAAVLESCRAYDNSGPFGIRAENGSLLINCAASFNVATGIFANSGSSLINCIATGNSGTYGIFANGGCTIINCTARANVSSGTGYGVYAEGASTVIGCTSASNSSTGATPTAGVGIHAGSGSTVKDCTVQGNKGDGIRVGANSQVLGNTCDANGNGTAGAPVNAANIRMTGSANRVELNLVTNCDNGIVAEADRNFIARNTARTNTANYSIVAGNRIAQIVVPAINGAAIPDGNFGSTDGFTAVDPWANFSF